MPGAPTLTATAGNGSVSLTWTAPPRTAAPRHRLQGLPLHRSGAETLLATLGNVTSYTDTALTNGTTYYYKVSAAQRGRRRRPLQRALRHPAPAAPGAPTAQRATAGNGSVSLSLDAPASNGGSPITGYTRLPPHQRAATRPCSPRVGTVTSYTDSALTNGTTYYYKVSAVNAVGESGLLQRALRHPRRPRPARRRSTRHRRQQAASRLSWTAPASNGGADHRLQHLPPHQQRQRDPPRHVGNVTSYTDTSAHQRHHLLLQGQRRQRASAKAASPTSARRRPPRRRPGAPTLNSRRGRQRQRRPRLERTGLRRRLAHHRLQGLPRHRERRRDAARHRRRRYESRDSNAL